jgi:cell division protein FtsZ
LLVSITGGNDLTLYEVDEAASRIRAEADPEANIIVGATFDDELDGSIRVSVVATGLGLLGGEQARPIAQDKTSLSQRLAGLAPVPMAPQEQDYIELKPSLPQKDEAGDAGVWSAPGNVTIERRPPMQNTGIALPHSVATQRPAPQTPKFVPAAPVSVRRTVRRMPNIDELPITAQNEIRAQSGAAPAHGLHEEKKRIGFFERLTGGRRTEETPAKCEPEFGQPTLAPAPKPQIVAAPLIVAAPKGPKIERPRSELGIAPAPKRLETPSRLSAIDTRSLADESADSDDLEIPAFLRRQAN